MTRKDLAVAVGHEIAFIRENIHAQLKDVAKKAKMTSAQLCKIEGGCNLPSDKTLKRIAKALDRDPEELIEIKARLAESFGHAAAAKLDTLAVKHTPQDPHFTELHASRYWDRDHQEHKFEDATLLSKLPGLIVPYLKLQDDIGASHFTAFEPTTNFKVTDRDAQLLAQRMRDSLSFGAVPIADAIPYMEMLGLRILFAKLPFGMKAKGYYDRYTSSYVFVISETATTEGQVYELASELAYMYLFARNGHTTVTYDNDVGVFVRAFAGCFLMPQETLIAFVDTLAMTRDDWTFDLVCALKWRFGVSAQAFIYRLYAGSLISPKRFCAIKDELHAYYEAHPDALEPNPAPKLRKNTWLATLKIRAASSPSQKDD